MQMHHLILSVNLSIYANAHIVNYTFAQTRSENRYRTETKPGAGLKQKTDAGLKQNPDQDQTSIQTLGFTIFGLWVMIDRGRKMEDKGV